MKKLALLMLLLFTVRVRIPMGIDIKYEHVKDVQLVPGSNGSVWGIILEDGRKAFTPFMWTVIEEETPEDSK